MANYLSGGFTSPTLADGWSGPQTLRQSANTTATDRPGPRPKGLPHGGLSALPTALGLDLNDLPLLLAVATTHSPHLADMYGLAVR